MPGTIRPPSSADLSSEMRVSVAGDPRIANAVTNYAPASSQLSALGHLSGDDKRMQRVCPICGVRYPAEFKVCPRDASELGEVSDKDRDELIGTTLSQTYSIVRVIGSP